MEGHRPGILRGFAFLVAVIFDQGIKYERAWRAPYELKQRLGYLDPARVAADPEAVRRAVASPPALHRYVNNLPSWIVAAARRVLDEYGGDAERIWNDDPTAEDLRRRLERFQGIGQKAVEILERQRGTAIRRPHGCDLQDRLRDQLRLMTAVDREPAAPEPVGNMLLHRFSLGASLHR